MFSETFCRGKFVRGKLEKFRLHPPRINDSFWKRFLRYFRSWANVLPLGVQTRYQIEKNSNFKFSSFKICKFKIQNFKFPNQNFKFQISNSKFLISEFKISNFQIQNYKFKIPKLQKFEIQNYEFQISKFKI